MVMVFGEITTKAVVDYEAVVRKVCKDVGFNTEADGGAGAAPSRTPQQSTYDQLCTLRWRDNSSGFRVICAYRYL
jgi:hypothetical protein